MRIAISIVVMLSITLHAGFFPVKRVTTVKRIEGGKLKLANPLPAVGMSGALIHNFKGVEALTGYIVQTSDKGDAIVVLDEVIDHEKLPGIKTNPQKGDKVIGGYLYENVMLLAPDAQNYMRIIEAYPHKTWFHPDLLAAFLSSEGEAVPTKALLKKFATAYQVGLFYIIKKDEAVLYDPISERVVARKPFKGAVKEAKFPFYMRFEKFRTGIFSDTSEEKDDYYNVMERFQ
jgi:hypothetical protein